GEVSGRTPDPHIRSVRPRRSVWNPLGPDCDGSRSWDAGRSLHHRAALHLPVAGTSTRPQMDLIVRPSRSRTGGVGRDDLERNPHLQVRLSLAPRVTGSSKIEIERTSHAIARLIFED